MLVELLVEWRGRARRPRRRILLVRSSYSVGRDLRSDIVLLDPLAPLEAGRLVRREFGYVWQPASSETETTIGIRSGVDVGPFRLHTRPPADIALVLVLSIASWCLFSSPSISRSLPASDEVIAVERRVENTDPGKLIAAAERDFRERRSRPGLLDRAYRFALRAESKDSIRLETEIETTRRVWFDDGLRRMQAALRGGDPDRARKEWERLRDEFPVRTDPLRERIDDVGRRLGW